MRFRTVLQEFEVHFQPVQPGSKAHGKAEWKHYGDGTYRFKLSLREIPLPDDSEIDVWRDGQWSLRLAVKDHRTKLDLEDDSGSGIPALKGGQILQIRSGQIILAEGRTEAE